MCGIAGFVGKRDRSTAEQAVRTMIGAMARRGPNGEGLESWDRAVLGHRRLSIFDLSDAGRQPMLSDDRKIGVVFNGAIYNFREIRPQLEARGYRFRSETDTEILIHGYREWGIDGLISRLHGMFAIGIWDEDRQTFFLFRDRLGVKPLYYVVRDGAIAFASTSRALRAAGLAGDLDTQAVTEFLEYGYVTDDRSIYQGVQKLGAAQLLEWRNGECRLRTYWTPSVAANGKAPSFEDAVQRTEELLLQAVEMRLFADVPVAVLLSGGIDSSLVCWAVSKLGGNLTAYTVGTPGDVTDESVDAAETARSLGIPHRILPLRPEDVTGLDDLTRAYGEPFACSSALGMLMVSQAVKSEATVLLTGDGGDDVYLGYREHLNLHLAQRTANWIPKPAAHLWQQARGMFMSVPQLRRPAHFLDYATGGLGAFTTSGPGLPEYRQRGILGERLAGAKLWQRSIEWSPESGRHVLSEMLDYDRKGRFVGEFMTKVDGATMHYALEARSPFLDQAMWEYAGALPYDVRLKDGKLKAVLRELARRHLGDRVASGRKRGFSIPAERWIGGRWQKQVREAFDGSLLAEEGWVDAAAVRREIDAANGSSSLRLWYLYVLESWLRYERSGAAVSAPAMAAS